MAIEAMQGSTFRDSTSIVLELILGGDNMAASFVLSRGGEMPLDDAVDGLIAVEKIIGEVIRNGRERIATEKTAKSANEKARDA